jgi:hypothetical protein
MTLRTPPSWLQNGSHPAENDRLTTQALFNTTGIIGSSSLAVTQNSPANMSVLVASGWAAIVGTTQSNMGTYVAYNDASLSGTITTANPSNPRIDLVCLTINDAYYTGSLNNVTLNIVAGTPASSPSVPATPANSIVLAQVAVGAGVTSITTANITDKRVATTTNLSIPSLTSTSTPTFSSNAYTTVLNDQGLLLLASNGGTAGTINIPTNASVAYAVGTNINIVQTGSGQLTIQAASSGTTTIYSTGGTSTAPKLRVQYSAATCIKTGTDTWYVFGDLA